MELSFWIGRAGQAAAGVWAWARRQVTPRRVSAAFLAFGGLLLALAAGYALYSGLATWLMGQDRYLLGSGIARLGMPTRTAIPPPTPTPAPTAPPTALPTARPTATPTPAPTPTSIPHVAPVQIRIPAIGVSRSIVALPRTRDASTGAYTWNTNRLFREGRSDLVGHWQGTAYPGEQGNMVLVGHNYGYGYNGVFVSLGQLRAGDKVIVVDQAGQTHTYQVTTVKRLKWRTKDFDELTQHLSFLSPGGPERVTLVSCAGADLEPFPERIYVVAEPVP